MTQQALNTLVKSYYKSRPKEAGGEGYYEIHQLSWEEFIRIAGRPINHEDIINYLRGGQ